MKLESLIATLSPAKQRAPRAIFLVGPPGSGKSTWRASYLASVDRPTTIISNDDMIDELAAQQGKTYSQVYPTIDHSSLDSQNLSRFRRALARRDDLIIDRTNMSAKSRSRYLAQVPQRYARIAVVFEVPEAVLLDRLRARAQATGKIIPMPVVIDMIANYQAPTTQEFDVVQVLQ